MTPPAAPRGAVDASHFLPHLRFRPRRPAVPANATRAGKAPTAGLAPPRGRPYPLGRKSSVVAGGLDRAERRVDRHRRRRRARRATYSVQLTVAGWMLVDDATGSTSGIVPASECESTPRSTARLLVVVVGLAGGGVPEPAGTDRVQSTSTRCETPVVPLIATCGYASTRYDDPAASDCVATCVALDPSVAAAVFDPNSLRQRRSARHGA